MASESMCASPTHDQEESGLSYEEKVLDANIISQPMASKKAASKIYKLLKKASKKRKTHLRIGLKAVQSKIRKGERGLVIMAGDVAPMDVICHMPAVCEEKSLPYIFTPSKKDMATAIGSKGFLQIALVIKDEEYEDLYEKVNEAIQKSNVNGISY